MIGTVRGLDWPWPVQMAVAGQVIVVAESGTVPTQAAFVHRMVLLHGGQSGRWRLSRWRSAERRVLMDGRGDAMVDMLPKTLYTLVMHFISDVRRLERMSCMSKTGSSTYILRRKA